MSTNVEVPKTIINMPLKLSNSKNIQFLVLKCWIMRYKFWKNLIIPTYSNTKTYIGRPPIAT